MMRYLAARYRVEEQWISQREPQRLLVERYQDWHHIGLRQPLMTLVLIRVFAPQLQRQFSPEQQRSAEKDVVTALRLLDQVWLRNTPFLTGSLPSIADISATCELTQLQLIPYDLAPYANVTRYLDAMSRLKSFQDVHASLFAVVQRRKATTAVADSAGNTKPPSKL